MDLPLQNQENSNIQGVSTLVKGKDTELMHSKHEMRRQVTDQAVTNSDKSKQNQQADPEKRGASPSSRFLGKESGSPQGQWQRRGNEKISPEIRGPLPNIERRRGPGPYFRDQTHQIRGLDQRDLGIERRNKWIGPQMRGSIPVRGEDECRNQSDWRDQYNRASAADTNLNKSMPDINPNIENLTHDRRGQEGQDFNKLESERGASTSDNVVPCIERSGAQEFSRTGPDSSIHPMEGHGLNSERTGFRGPWSDVRSPENVSFGAGRARDREISGQGPENRPHTRTDRRGPFSEMGHERNDLIKDAQRPSRRGPRGQDLREPVHERSDPLVERPGTETEEPNDQGFRGTGLQRRGPFTEAHGQDPNRPGGPNFRGQLPERRGPPLKDIEPDMRGSGLQRGGPPLEGPRYDRGGQEYPSFRGPGPQRRDASMEDPLHDMRGPGNPGFRGPDPQRRGHGHDIGGPEKPGFKESGPEKDCTPECAGNLGAGPGRPDFTETIPESKGPPLEGPWHDKCPGGLNNRGPWPKQRSPFIEGPGFDRSGQRALDLKGKGINMEDHGQDVRGPHNPQFREIGLQRRGPPLEGPGPGPGPGNRRGPEAPNFRGSGPEIRDPSMERPGSDMGGHDGQDFSGPLFERRGPSNESHWPDGRGPVGPDIRESGPEKRGHLMEGTGNEMRGFQGPDFRRKEPGTRSDSTEVPGHDRTRSDHDRGGPGTQHLRVPRPERGGPPVEGVGFDTKQPLGPDFRGPERRGPSLERPGPDRRGTDFMRPGVEKRDHIVEDLWTNRRGPQGPDFRGPRPECRNPAMEGIAPVRKDVGCTGFGTPGPGRQGLRGTGNDISNTVDCQEHNSGGPSGSDVLRMGSSRGSRGGSNLRGPGFERSSPTMQDPGLDRGGQYRIGSGPNMEGPVPSRWDPDVKGPRPRRPGFGMERSGFSNTREPGIEHLGQTSDETGQNRRGPNCQGFPGARHEGRPLDKEGPEPCRGSQHFRGARGARPRTSVMHGPGPVNRERSDFRDLVPESRGQDEGQDWRLGGPDFGDPDTGLRDSNTVNPIHTDGTGQDFEGSEFIQGGPGIQRRGCRTGPNFRGRGLIRRRPRGRRANQSNQEDRWEGQDFEGIDPQQQWSDQREPDMMAPGNEGDFPEEEWNSGPGQPQEIPNEQLQEFTRQGPDTGYRGHARRGRRPMQARPNMPFPGPLSRSGEEWGGPDHSDQDPAQDDPVFQGPERGRPGNRWRESYRGHNRGVPSPFYRGGRHPNSRGRGHERISDMNGPRSDFREGPDFLNSGPECRASTNEAPGGDRRFVGGGETVPGSDQQEFKAPHFNGPHQVPRFKGPFDPYAASNIRPRGTAPNTGQNQEAGRLFRHRSGLLPTPGRSRFPNRGRGQPDSSFDM